MSNVKYRGKTVVAQNDETAPQENVVSANPSQEADRTDNDSAITFTATTTTPVHTTTTANTAQTQQLQQQLQLQQQQQQQRTYLPQTSLLKIEPFVPSFNQRLRRRPIGRSYSTLSSTVIHKRNTSSGGGSGGGSSKMTLLQQPKAELIIGAAVDGSISPQQLKRNYAATHQLQRQPLPSQARGIVTRQRSKSTSSSAASNSCRPATAAVLNGNIGIGNMPSGPTSAPNNSRNSSGAIVQAQSNGICRITRLPKEREELPDRINYDRRGLTAVPIFEHEPHLRLLSLQHNLINIFHIPKEQTQPLATSATATTKETKNEDQINTNCQNGCTSKTQTLVNGRLSRQRYNNNNNNNRLSMNTSSPKSSSPTQSPLSALSINGAAGGASCRPKLLKRHSLLQKNFNFSNAQLPPATSTPQHQQQQLQQPLLQRFTLEKSKSFVTNYTRHLQSIKQQQQNLSQRRALLLQANARDGSKLKSLDSGASIGMTATTNPATAASDLFEDPETALALEELSIKNKQLSLSASYGNIFQHLVFLDLYDNQIERIASLDGLPTLTVLLLGKNRIMDISGLNSLRHTLRVLDLHGNKITSISNKINCLHELKSLNLAGNQIRQINHNDFSGLRCLKELNLKRNKLKRINGFQHLTALERLWLCHNELHKVEDMATIVKATRLHEVTIENNPVSLAGDCVSFLVSYLPLLQMLSQMPITEQVRRAALAWRQHKELAEAQTAHPASEAFNSIRREEVISNARTNWELLRSQQTVQTTLRAQRSPKKLTSELAKISESNENVTCVEASSSSVLEELQALIKLPPIEQQQKKKEPTDDGSSDASSLGPNVDSSSSCYSTDTEEVAVNGDGLSGGGGGSAKQNIDDNSNNLLKPTGNCQTVRVECDEKLKKTAIHLPQSTARKHNETTSASGSGSGCSGTSGIAPTTTITLPQPQTSEQLERPSSTRQRSGATTRAALNTPTTPINGSSSSLGFHYNKLTATNNGLTNTANNTAARKRYTSGSLMRAQTVACNGGISSGRGSSSSTSFYPNRTTAAAAATPSSAHQNASANGNQTTTMLTAASANVVSIVAPISTNETTTTTATVTTISTTIGSPTPTNTNASTTLTMTTSASATTTATILGKSTATTPSVSSSPVTTPNSTAIVAVTVTKPTAAEREREQGGDYLIEICGRYLNIYGQGALRFIDKQWNPAKANDVHTLNFSYINFNNITAVLGRIKVRFPHAENFVFRETNISCLGQLNALAELQGITTLFIDVEGNEVTTKDLWRSYAIYRLSHWGLKQLNGIEVTAEEIETANIMYTGLSDLVLWSMPDVMLQPLLARLRLDETCIASKMSPKEWLMRTDNKSLRLVVGKEALQWKKASASGSVGGGFIELASSSANAPLSTRERGRQRFALMMEHTCNAVEKLHKLEALWPSMLLDIVRNTLLDYAQLDVYLRSLMSEIMK